MSILCLNGTNYNFPNLPNDTVMSDYLTNVTRVTLPTPMTALPPSLCSLPSHQIDLSNQQFSTLSPATFPCLDQFRQVNLASNLLSSVNEPTGNFTNLMSLDLSNNILTSIPYSILRPTPSSLSYLDLRNNSISAIDLFLYTLKNITVRLEGNPINSLNITNTQNVSIPITSSNDSSSLGNISLPSTLTGQLFILNDQEASAARVCTPAGIEAFLAASKLANASVQLDCSCASISLRMAYASNGTSITDRFTCANGTNAVTFNGLTSSSCSSPLNLTATCGAPIPNYPHNETRAISPGACVFTFTSATAMSILCLNGTNYNFSSFPNDTVFSGYLANVTRVTLPTPMSVLPPSLCSLPSRQIDLSNQQFTALSPATFPCLDQFRTVNLEYNSLTTVNEPTGNFTNLMSLDLSNNNLTSVPYSILRPTPSALSYLDLRNNSIPAIDLFLYTLKNITVNLDGNPINNLTIINPQNVSIPTSASNGTASVVIVILPMVLAGQLFILNDQVASTARVCTPAGVEAYIAVTGLSNGSIRLDCSCASIGLKTIYANNGTSITDRFTCTNGTGAATFIGLTSSSCFSSINLAVGCADLPSTTAAPGPVTDGSAPTVSSSSSSSNNTGLIVGLVVGLFFFLLLLILLIILIIYCKGKSAASAAAAKPVGRGTVLGQAPSNSVLQSRVSTRNPRAVRLAPLPSNASRLPLAPVAAVLPPLATSTAPTTAPLPPRAASKGIPLRLDPIRSPTNVNPQIPPASNGPDLKSSFRPINNPTLARPTAQTASSQPNPPRARPNAVLNTGGDSTVF